MGTGAAMVRAAAAALRCAGRQHELNAWWQWLACPLMGVACAAVGRFLNHSARPNVFMQCVFTGTCAGQEGKYDERMPTLSFFAMCGVFFVLLFFAVLVA